MTRKINLQGPDQLESTNITRLAGLLTPQFQFTVAYVATAHAPNHVTGK